MTLANMTQQETDEHNREHCKRIADELELIAEGRMYRCFECEAELDCEEYAENDEFYNDVTEGNTCLCPHCGELTEFEQVSMGDWLSDALDLNYVTTRDFQYKAARVMVAFGGPTIYVDTYTGRVELYWWSDRAEYGLTNAACAELDDYLEDYFDCVR